MHASPPLAAAAAVRLAKPPCCSSTSPPSRRQRLAPLFCPAQLPRRAPAVAISSHAQLRSWPGRLPASPQRSTPAATPASPCSARVRAAVRPCSPRGSLVAGRPLRPRAAGRRPVRPTSRTRLSRAASRKPASVPRVDYAPGVRVAFSSAAPCRTGHPRRPGPPAAPLASPASASAPRTLGRLLPCARWLRPGSLSTQSSHLCPALLRPHRLAPRRLLHAPPASAAQLLDSGSTAPAPQGRLRALPFPAACRLRAGRLPATRTAGSPATRPAGLTYHPAGLTACRLCASRPAPPPD
ncbi:hypothetical protein VPH35_014547 [Triticum aestivum]